MKKLGIIGGMGPLATAYFYRRIVELTPATTDQEHIETLIYSCPAVPDRTAFLLSSDEKKLPVDCSGIQPLPLLPEVAVLEGDASPEVDADLPEDPRPKMIEVGRKLRSCGADVLAMPCVTAHAFHKDLEEGIGVPVIHAIRELGALCKSKNITKPGIMATDGAMLSGIYDDILSEFGVTCVWPDKEGQKKVMSMIYDDVKAGRILSEEAFNQVGDELFRAGAQAIVLGCTELSQAMVTMDPGDKYIDIIDVLAQACVRECTGA